MSTFDIRQDAPGLLRTESLSVNIVFSRTGPTTGRVSWNIPTPAAGCTADDQAYCGMLATLDTTPAGPDKSPTNGQIYASDPTANTNLFSGDTISSALVIGAFYQDRTTTFFDITGLKPNTPYYVSGYPVDCQYRYYGPGVHAYSQNLTTQKGTDSTTGTQVVALNPSNQNFVVDNSGQPFAINSLAPSESGSGLTPTDITGLAPGVEYNFMIQLGVVPAPVTPGPPPGICPPVPPTYTITINGTDGATYQDLIDAINEQLAQINNPPVSPYPPNANGLYWNSTSQKLFEWNGYVHVEIPVIVQATAPTILIVGSYWYNPDTGVIQIWNGVSWGAVVVITFATDPMEPICDKTHWFDGTVGYLWNGTTWCEKVTYTSNVDPSVQYPAPCGSFWYDTDDLILYRWNIEYNSWVETLAIQYSQDPNALPVGAFWFDETNMVLNAWDTPNPGWNAQTNVAIQETAPTTPAPGKFWYNPATMELWQWDGFMWVALEVIPFPTDPTIRSTCDLWWDTTTDEMKIWDSVNNEWDIAAVFYQQDEDPTLPPSLSDGDLWYDPNTSILYVWQNNCFIVVSYINWATDPVTTLPDGTVWYDGIIWYVKTGGTWVVFEPIVTTQDPSMLAVGSYWFNTSNNTLQIWNGAAWVNIAYSTTPYTPATGSMWFNTATNTLMTWDGTTWVPATTAATVEMDCAGNLLFTDNTLGSLSFVRLTDGTLFMSLNVPYAFMLSTPGTDGVSNELSYEELGIGTDGTNDERFKLMNEIRYQLGYPVFPVELTQEQLSFCIDRALEEARQKTAIAYKHGWFFMRVNAETQRYYLTNKVSGMNKIVTVMGVYRLTSAFLSSAQGAGIYGQIVLQHLYNMGTFDLLSYHIIADYVKLMEILFASRVTFTWDEQKRELWMDQRFAFNERMVLIEAGVERVEQDIITDRWCRPWIRRFATATAYEILANIRGKFSTLPGAGGGITLNAAELSAKAAEEKLALYEEIDNYVMDKPEDYGMATQFIFG